MLRTSIVMRLLSSAGLVVTACQIGPPAGKPSLGYLEHRGVRHGLRELTEPDYRAASGEGKVGEMLLDFMLTSPFTVRWFRPGPASDFNHDGHVDFADFDRFQACVSGPGNPPVDPYCLACDLDVDDDNDQADFGLFQNCLSGPDDPVDPACGP
ncbi:MAG: hypothetical protein HY718_11440 [Planctomycetes bacterium]|nr:hypothetical protein [Planctomycetota bacterium]